MGKPKLYEEPKYDSRYQDRIDAALGKVTDRQEFAYDPLKDANYQALAGMYESRGRKASQNVMGDAAALNGGYGSSFALTASQQMQNDFNQQLAAQIPALQEMAYNRYLNEHNMDIAALGALRDADQTDYAKHRDSVADDQWRYGAEYQGYRDDTADAQWNKAYARSRYESNRDYEYQKKRDKVTDKQWAKEFALRKKSAASRGGGGSSRGGNGYVGSRSSDSNGYSSSSAYESAKDFVNKRAEIAAKKKAANKKLHYEWGKKKYGK